MTEGYSFFAQNGAVYATQWTTPSGWDTMTDTQKVTALEAMFTSSVTPVMAVQNCTVEAQCETVPLWSWSTVKRVDIARHEAKVTTNFEYAKVVSEDLFKYILNPHVETSTGGSVTSPLLSNGVSIADTTDLYRFVFKMRIPSTDGTKALVVYVTDLVFSNLPLGGELGEWVKLNLEGEGADEVIKIETISS